MAVQIPQQESGALQELAHLRDLLASASLSGSAGGTLPQAQRATGTVTGGGGAGMNAAVFAQLLSRSALVAHALVPVTINKAEHLSFDARGYTAALISAAEEHTYAIPQSSAAVHAAVAVANASCAVSSISDLSPIVARSSITTSAITSVHCGNLLVARAREILRCGADSLCDADKLSRCRADPFARTVWAMFDSTDKRWYALTSNSVTVESAVLLLGTAESSAFRVAVSTEPLVLSRCGCSSTHGEVDPQTGIGFPPSGCDVYMTALPHDPNVLLPVSFTLPMKLHINEDNSMSNKENETFSPVSSVFVPIDLVSSAIKEHASRARKESRRQADATAEKRSAEFKRQFMHAKNAVAQPIFTDIDGDGGMSFASDSVMIGAAGDDTSFVAPDATMTPRALSLRQQGLTANTSSSTFDALSSDTAVSPPQTGTHAGTNNDVGSSTGVVPTRALAGRPRKSDVTDPRLAAATAHHGQAQGPQSPLSVLGYALSHAHNSPAHGGYGEYSRVAAGTTLSPQSAGVASLDNSRSEFAQSMVDHETSPIKNASSPVALNGVATVAVTGLSASASPQSPIGVNHSQVASPQYQSLAHGNAQASQSTANISGPGVGASAQPAAAKATRSNLRNVVAAVTTSTWTGWGAIRSMVPGMVTAGTPTNATATAADTPFPVAEYPTAVPQLPLQHQHQQQHPANVAVTAVPPVAVGMMTQRSRLNFAQNAATRSTPGLTSPQSAVPVASAPAAAASAAPLPPLSQRARILTAGPNTNTNGFGAIARANTTFDSGSNRHATRPQSSSVMQQQHYQQQMHQQQQRSSSHSRPRSQSPHTSAPTLQQ